MKTLWIMIMLVLFGKSIQAQVVFSCGYNNGENSSECILVTSNTQQNEMANQVIDNILNEVGLPKNFTIIACNNIQNALAITSANGIRYIVYDREFIGRLSNLTTNWTNSSILAHEIGHHLSGHTLKKSLSLSDQRDKELEADEFSGFVLNRLGATLGEAQAAIRLIATDQPDENSSHPARLKRLSAIEKGFQKAKASQKVQYVRTGPEPETYFYKGLKLTDERKYKEAIDSYTAAIQLNPKFSAAYLNRANVKLQEDVKEPDDIIEDCNKAISLEQDYGAAYYNRGLAYMFKNDYVQALKDLDKAILLDSSVNSPHFFLTREFIKSKVVHKDKSIPELNTLINKRPDDPGLYHERAIAKMKEEDFPSAINDLTKAIKLDKRNPVYYDFRGMCKVYLDQHREAINDFDTSIMIKPEIAISYFNRAMVYKKLDEFSKVLPDLNVCVILEPDNKEYLNERGFARRMEKDNEGSVEDYDKLLEMDRNNDTYWLERGVSKAMMGKFKQAIKDIETAIEINPSSENMSFHLYHLGLCKIALGEKTFGCKQLQKSCSMGLQAACDDLKEYCK